MRHWVNPSFLQDKTHGYRFPRIPPIADLKQHSQKLGSMVSRSTAQSSSRTEEELDEFDLFRGGDTASPVPDTDLSATMQAFHTRIQRKKREQEKVLSEADRIARQRHALMLKALMNIRKSLREVTRIELGDRFCFALVVDDWQGWPRLTLRLHDVLMPQGDYPFLRVTGHDRQQRGAIEIEYDPSQPAETLSLMLENDIKRLPNALKRCVRSFLDLTGDIMLEAERREDEVTSEGALQSTHTEGFYGDQPKDAGPALSDDLYADDMPRDDLFESLPNLERVDQLPE